MKEECLFIHHTGILLYLTAFKNHELVLHNIVETKATTMLYTILSIRYVALG